MTLLTERPATPAPASDAAAAVTVSKTALIGGSYVTLPTALSRTHSEGAYVTAPGNRNVSLGSYVTVLGVHKDPVGGSYVTLCKAA
ncbi:MULTISPECIES: hypothetical protein [Micrococcaceae]|uniref:hypothetical protein n=1 Tax=Micrococcaceae TaxID=1268 RepID=UPI001F3AB072|nr:hypothetical protein [Paenarthrobacter sp. AR 02]MCF3141414.1 hypothetical protein [Paenarthrobacter sp. AR 02]